MAGLAPWATVLVAVAALVYTNQAGLAQQRLAERGQITDRFSRAIDQLGQEGVDKLDLRLGGIYALERIMRDSPDDESAIVEVLCAFVRDHTRQAPASSPTPAPSASRSRAAAPPTTDVQAALTVLGRRPRPEDPRHE